MKIKNLCLSVCAGLALGLTAVSLMLPSARATGFEGVNPSQQGTLYYTGATGLVLSNTFAFPFTVPPAMVFTPQSTNGSPFTVNSITLTNFSYTVTANSATNCAINWSAVPGYPRVQTGTCVSGGGTNFTVTFPVQYALLTVPTVTAIGGLAGTPTNGYVTITSVTSSNFVIQTAANCTNQWQAFGYSYTPGLYPVTY